MRHMETANSQAALTRVSVYTIAMQAGMDAFLCLMHLTTGIIVEALFNAFALAAFCKFVLFSMFEMRYFVSCWKAQLPQGAWGEAEQERREVSALYSRTYALCIALIVLGYRVPTLTFPLTTLGFSFWLPQIFWNVVKDADPRRPAFSTQYVVGMTCSRLVVPLYLHGWSGNFLHLKPNRLFCGVLVVYALAQMVVLLAQQKYGTSAVIPSSLIPAKYRPYDYHRKPRQRRRNEVECVICMAIIEDTGVGCMVTPCEHVFHADCLQQWMEIKMECPSCRAQLL